MLSFSDTLGSEIKIFVPGKIGACDERRDRLTKKRLEMVESPSNVESKLVRLENRHFFTQIKILKKEFLPCKASCTVGKKSARDFWHVHKDWSTVKIFLKVANR